MRRGAVEADRRRAVRDAAEAWRKAGAIDEATERSIDAAYPDDRHRLGIGLRILAGVVTACGGFAAPALLASMLHMSASLLTFTLAVAFVAATEIQTGKWRRAQAGAEYASGILAAICASVFVLEIFDSGFGFGDAVTIAVLWGLAAWRWGFALFGVVGTFFLLVAANEANLLRTGAFALGILALPALLGHERLLRLAPAHRRTLDWSSALGLAAAYAACNVYALDQLGLEPFDMKVPAQPTARVLAIVATTVFPIATLLLGILRRRRSLLLLGALFTAASCATLRFYVHIAPLWAILVLSGVACAGLALAVRRWLEAGEGRERAGFTAEPLYDTRRGVDLAQAAATIAALTPSATPAAARPTFEGGGGTSGGGGAQGQF